MRKNVKTELVCILRALVMLAAALALIAWPVAGTAQDRAAAEAAFEKSIGNADAALNSLEEQIAASQAVMDYITVDKYDDGDKQEAAAQALDHAHEVSGQKADDETGQLSRRARGIPTLSPTTNRCRLGAGVKAGAQPLRRVPAIHEKPLPAFWQKRPIPA